MKFTQIWYQRGTFQYIFLYNFQEPLDSSSSNLLKNCSGRFVSKGRLVANVEAMVEDFSIIGSGIVKEVVCNITS